MGTPWHRFLGRRIVEQKPHYDMAAGRPAVALAVALVAVGISLGTAITWRGRGDGARCGPGFDPQGVRCLVPAGGPCPTPLEQSASGCRAPDVRAFVREASITVGPSDWEAEGRVTPRVAHSQAFRIDAFEATRARYAGEKGRDGVRAASGMTRGEASSFCAAQGGRLPTEDEWMIAAASGESPPRRYPWGDTGAVCRRAAWGLLVGPCATRAGGPGGDPDTVGAHPDGDSPLGLHDLAGNVAEWVSTDAARPGVGVAKGGSWESQLASDLRIWARLELEADAADPRVGVRCVYPP